MNTQTHIPDDSEVTVGSGRTQWRIASGRVCKGNKESDPESYEEKPNIVGQLVRIGTFAGTKKDTGKPYEQLEVDLLRSTGATERVKVDLNRAQPGVSALQLAAGLLLARPGAVISIEPNQSSKKNAYGTYSTFVNLFELDTSVSPPKKRELRPLRTDTPNPQKIESDLAELATRSDWKCREPYSEDDGEGVPNDAPWDHFDCIVVGKGWPGFHDQEPAWLESFSKGFGRKIGTVADVKPEEWQQLIEGTPQRTKCPQIVLDAAKGVAAKPKVEDWQNPDGTPKEGFNEDGTVDPFGGQ